MTVPPLAVSRVRQVFQFLKAFAERNVPVRRSLAEYDWVQPIAELPAYPTIFVGSVTTAAAEAPDDDPEGERETQPLLRVARPKLTEAPAPPSLLNDWIQGRWNDPFVEPQVRETLEPRDAHASATDLPRFVDEPKRFDAMQTWLAKWRAWAETERPARTAMGVFDRFYALYGRIARESERVELTLGDGRLRHGLGLGADHPVLLQRVELQFDPNVPEFRVVDSDRTPELYSPILQEMADVSGETLNALRREVEAGGYHPLGDDGTAAFLNRLANSLGSDTRFVDYGAAVPSGVPTVTRDRSLFLRHRMSGMPAALDGVLQHLEETNQVPTSLSRVVGVDPAAAEDEDALPDVSPWGEPPDVLFSKEANLEQVRIARALERHKAVLVQGPPGTGKSHTIANLIGHLVANGKRVLVTSHTTKALRVLRNHVVKELRPLCVSLLDQDLEGRVQLEHAVRGIVARVGASNENTEAARAEQLEVQRERLMGEVERLTRELESARRAEYEPIVLGDERIVPAEGARVVRADRARHDWLPGPLERGAPLPLEHEQLVALYETNRSLSPEEERELNARPPANDQLIPTEQFAADVTALGATEAPELSRFWERPAAPEDLVHLEAIASRLATITVEGKEMAPWQRELATAGRSGDTERSLWIALRQMVAEAAAAFEHDRELLMTYDVYVYDEETLTKCHKAVGELLDHVRAGGSLGKLKLMGHSDWKTVLQVVKVDGAQPSTVDHFAAIQAVLKANSRRAALARRWNKQAVPIGLPIFATVGQPPERLLLDYVDQFERWLDWWGTEWGALEPALRRTEFRWSRFREHHVARGAPVASLERDLMLLTGPLQDAIGVRLTMVKGVIAEDRLHDYTQMLGRHGGRTVLALRRAVDARDVDAYGVAREALVALNNKSEIWDDRRAMLADLAQSAPRWAAAVRAREPKDVHGAAELPGDAQGAWRWRQLEEELDRRAKQDEQEIMRKLKEARDALRRTTIELIDASAWLAQLRRTDLAARQALIGWSDTQKKIGKGTGKRVPELQAQARDLLTKAREAVPVWIMPLARVAESFDPREEKFDVVIVDEASQSDVTGLLAFYLGHRVIVVGDHEQVSPSAVGQRIEELQGLRMQHLAGVPNQHLYDGQTSIYDLARQSFGGTIALREHFRCVPEIIDFSNYLSYHGQILPLRDPATAKRPHVIEHPVTTVLGGRVEGKTNEDEARAAAALIAAMCDMKEYKDRTLGVISLVGDEQALLIQERVLPLVGAVELEKRRFAAGNPAQFQGDERDVMLLSMVDSPNGGTLRIRADESTKQRYNVAVSRARDQVWLLHSLDPSRDLQPGDLRRRLIEHVRDPRALRRQAVGDSPTAGGVESAFEREVCQRLTSRGYRVRPQVEVGHYHIDLVVCDGDAQVAVECDGDRSFAAEKVPEDLARQAVLERCGWRFVRLRGTRFYRDPDAAMRRVYKELERQGVRPDGAQEVAEDDALREQVVRRAEQIMVAQGWHSS